MRRSLKAYLKAAVASHYVHCAGQNFTKVFVNLALEEFCRSVTQGVESVKKAISCPCQVQLLTQIQHGDGLSRLALKICNLLWICVGQPRPSSSGSYTGAGELAPCGTLPEPATRWMFCAVSAHFQAMQWWNGITLACYTPADWEIQVVEVRCPARS